MCLPWVWAWAHSPFLGCGLEVGIFMKVPPSFEDRYVDEVPEAIGIDIGILCPPVGPGTLGHAPSVLGARGMMKVLALGLSKGLKQGALCRTGSEMCACVISPACGPRNPRAT